MMLRCEVRISRRPGLAWAGVAALLFQAIVFGWHSHSLPLSSPGHAVISAPSPASPFSPADLDTGCSICLALHHWSSLPVEFAGLPRMAFAVRAAPPQAALSLTSEPSTGFNARAPPPTPSA